MSPLAGRVPGGALPRRGAWSDEDYLRFTDHTRRLIEFTNGRVQELPMPTAAQQAVLAFLYRLFHACIEPRGGVVLSPRYGCASARAGSASPICCCSVTVRTPATRTATGWARTSWRRSSARTTRGGI